MYTPEEIKKLRVSLGLNRKQFAGKLGVDPSAVTLWENGERTPREKTEEKMAGLESLPKNIGHQHSAFLRALNHDLETSSQFEFSIMDDQEGQILKLLFASTASYNRIKRALLDIGGEIL